MAATLRGTVTHCSSWRNHIGMAANSNLLSYFYPSILYNIFQSIAYKLYKSKIYRHIQAPDPLQWWSSSVFFLCSVHPSCGHCEFSLQRHNARSFCWISAARAAWVLQCHWRHDVEPGHGSVAEGFQISSNHTQDMALWACFNIGL